jgi:hypothetical protein
LSVVCWKNGEGSHHQKDWALFFLLIIISIENFCRSSCVLSWVRMMTNRLALDILAGASSALYMLLHISLMYDADVIIDHLFQHEERWSQFSPTCIKFMPARYLTGMIWGGADAVQCNRNYILHMIPF